MESKEHQKAATKKLLQNAQTEADSLGKTVDDVLTEMGLYTKDERVRAD